MTSGWSTPLFVVRMIGLEPTRLTTPDPKSGAAANYATCAGGCIESVGKDSKFFLYYQFFVQEKLLMGCGSY